MPRSPGSTAGGSEPEGGAASGAIEAPLGGAAADILTDAARMPGVRLRRGYLKTEDDEGANGSALRLLRAP